MAIGKCCLNPVLNIHPSTRCVVCDAKYDLVKDTDKCQECIDENS